MSAALSLVSRPGIHSDVWQADALAHAPARVQASGHGVLDVQLPGGGWPVGALTEILQPVGVHAEWRLLLPALVRSALDQYVVLVGAPQTPFAPALAARGLEPRRLLWVAAQADPARHWSTEQALRCADVAAVLAWLPQARADVLRRLQLAAAEHAKLLFVMRPWSAHQEASPAALRLGVQARACQDTLEVEIFKRRGPPLAHAIAMQAKSLALARLLADAPQEVEHALDRLATQAG